MGTAIDGSQGEPVTLSSNEQRPYVRWLLESATVQAIAGLACREFWAPALPASLHNVQRLSSGEVTYCNQYGYNRNHNGHKGVKLETA